MSYISVPPDRPRHGVLVRDRTQNNGFFVNNEAYYVFSGTLDGVVGSTTGSVSLRIDAYGIKLKRYEVFHSGAASTFDTTLERSWPNTGSFYDPRNLVVDYLGVAGSNDYSGGVDQVEDLVSITDSSGSMYLKFKPYGAGNNSFKYLLYFEAIYIYVE